MHVSSALSMLHDVHPHNQVFTTPFVYRAKYLGFQTTLSWLTNIGVSTGTLDQSIKPNSLAMFKTSFLFILGNILFKQLAYPNLLQL